MEEYLRSTDIIDSDSPKIKRKAIDLTSQIDTDREKAKALFYFVRDRIKYRIAVFQAMEKEIFGASFTLKRGYGFCITKSILLIALLRAINIPARLCFADIRNHLMTDNFRKFSGTDIMAFHGYAELFINGLWIKVNSAFDIDLCRENKFIPVDFTGDKDALAPLFDLKGRPHFEYVKNRGSFADLPYDTLLSGLVEFYGHRDEQQMAEWNQGYY